VEGAKKFPNPLRTEHLSLFSVRTTYAGVSEREVSDPSIYQPSLSIPFRDNPILLPGATRFFVSFLPVSASQEGITGSLFPNPPRTTCTVSGNRRERKHTYTYTYREGCNPLHVAALILLQR